MLQETYFILVNILNAQFSNDYCKDSSYAVNITAKPEGTGHTGRSTMGFAAKPIRKARETYWMHELQNIFPYGLNDTISDEFKTGNKHINVAAKFSSLPKKIYSY